MVRVSLWDHWTPEHFGEGYLLNEVLTGGVRQTSDLLATSEIVAWYRACKVIYTLRSCLGMQGFISWVFHKGVVASYPQMCKAWR